MNAVKKERAKSIANHPGTWITLAIGVISYFITQFGGDKIENHKTVDNTNEQEIYQVLKDQTTATNHRIDLTDKNVVGLESKVDLNYENLCNKTEKIYKMLLNIDMKVDDLRALRAENKTENTNLTTTE